MGHTHDKSSRRTVIIIVPDHFQQPQLRWTLTAHISAHATWNQADRKKQYVWDDAAGHESRELVYIGTALAENSDELAGDMATRKTHVKVQMVGSANACFDIHTRPDMPLIAFVGLTPFPITPIVKNMKRDASGRLKCMGKVIREWGKFFPGFLVMA